MFDFPGGADRFTGYTNRDSIYTVNSYGFDPKEWTPTDGPLPSSDPFYAGDYAPHVMGDKVVFTTLRHACSGSKGYEIATANLDGSGYRRLTDADGADLLPTWSPDGSRIAFLSNRTVYDDSDGSIVTSQKARDNFNAYVMDADGSNVRNLAPEMFLSSNRHISNRIITPATLVWSPSGWLAFHAGNFLYGVHPEKPGVVTVGQTSADPAWSPDGEWIAWAHSEPGSIRNRVYYGAAIYVAEPDGSETRRVFQMSSTAWYEPVALDLSWTPDGQSLRFVFAPPHFKYGLYQLSLDAPSPILIAEVKRGARVVWSPDGSRALVSTLATSHYISPYDDGEELLYTIAADGSDKRVLVRYSSNRPVAGYGE